MNADDVRHAYLAARFPFLYPFPGAHLPKPEPLPVDSWEARFDRAFVFARAQRIPDAVKFAETATFAGFERLNW